MIEQIPVWWYFDLYRWQDAVEIVLLSGVLYYLSRWLAQDHRKPLVFILYSYCALLAFSDYAYLPTINALALLFLPILCAILLLIHRDTLQKNFIALHAITPAEQPQDDWIESLVRAALAAAGDNRPFSCVVEKKEALDTILVAPHQLNAPVSVELLRLINSSTLVNTHLPIWINARAQVQSYNCSWYTNSVTDWLLQEASHQELWLREALFFTTKADALFFRLVPETRTFTIVAQGKVLAKAGAQQTCLVLRTYLGYSPHSKGAWNVPLNQTVPINQTRP